MHDKQTPILVETEPDALFQHWRKMAMITLQAATLDLDKLQYCLLRLHFWQERINERANSNPRELEVRR